MGEILTPTTRFPLLFAGCGQRTPLSMAASGPIHVLHVRIVTGTGGGPEKTILNSPRHLEGTRYRASACWLHAPGDPGIALLEAKARERNCPFLAIEDPHPYDLRTLLRLAVHADGLGSPGIFGPAAATVLPPTSNIV